jgi:hypothetical protein
MKKLLLTGLALLGLCASSFATITINLGGGYIYFADGLTRAPVGSLVQLLVSRTDNIFSAPSPTSFTGDSSDDLVLASFAVNQEPGVFLQDIVFSLSGTLGTGDHLLLRWFPTLTTSSSEPGAGTQYGEFRSDFIENNSTTNWTVPADGQTHDLNFITMSLGGSRPDSEGAANLAVIPEPTTYALLATGLGALALVRRRNKAAK